MADSDCRYPRKIQSFLHIVLFDPDLDGRRAKQMPCIHKPNADSICKVDFFVIIASNKTVDRSCASLISYSGTTSALPARCPFRFFHSASNICMCALSRSIISHRSAVALVAKICPRNPLWYKSGSLPEWSI